MMTVHKLSVGDGYRYYTHEVASGDALCTKDRELGDYYTVNGMPPGQWIGSSVHELGVRGNVTEAQMHTLFGGTAKPLTPEQFSEIEALANQIHAQTYSVSIKEQQERIMRQNYRLLRSNVVQGKTQEELGKALGIGQRAVSKRMAALEANGWNRARFKFESPTYQQFAASFSFTDEQNKRIEVKAMTAANKAAENYRKEQGHQQATPSYDGVSTAFKELVSARIAEHKNHTGREATAAEKRNFRLAIGAAKFKEEHKYEPENEELMRYIQRLEKPRQTAVAGYDLVFSPTKSVSIAWGLGNENLRKGIEAAHEKAIADVVQYLEENALYTRRGQGGIAQIDVDGGVIGTKFRHYDSREGDPNLHDHLVIVNRVKGSDGKWSSIDGRNIYGYGVSASELYNTKIAQYIHQNLGLEFTAVQQNGREIFELAGIEGETIKAFSSRRTAISMEYKKAHQQFVADHGYEPNPRQIKELYQQVTLSTRPAKSEARSLQELNTQWVEKAQHLKGAPLPTGDELEQHLRKSSTKVAQEVIEGQAEALALRPQQHAERIIHDLEQQRATWSNRHIEAEAQRYFRSLTKGSFVDEKLFAESVKFVKGISVTMHVTDTTPVPKEKQRSDGTSVYVRADSQLYTSHRVIKAEKDLVQASLTPALSPASRAIFEAELAKHKQDNQISPAQENMAKVFTTSNKLLAVGIGPAGAGKTTSTKLTVKTAHAAGKQVIGLAPTAVAAQVMSEELGIKATTLDAFLMGSSKALTPQQGDILLVDEIGMVATPKLHELLRHAQTRGAVIRGMGDTRQLSAVGAGGALRLIEREAGAAYLEDVFRFRNADGSLNMEEVNASLALREPAFDTVDKPFEWYLKNDRIVAGKDEVMLNQVFNNWVTDVEAGKNSIMLGPTNAAVNELNLKAQLRAIALGQVKDKTRSVILSDNNASYAGDTIVTRKNNGKLRLRGGKDSVKNGDQWKILKVNNDGSLLVRNTKHRGKITLPAGYVEENVELGYALTVNRSQGATVDTVHAYLDKSTDRAGAYVGLTRGKFSNRIYIATDEETTRDEVLEAITNNYDRNLSVHEEMERLRAADRDVATRLNIYNDLTEHAVQEAYKPLIRKALGVETGNEVIASGGFGALVNEMSKTYREGIDPAAALAEVNGYKELSTAEDKGAVLQWRLKAAVQKHKEIFEKKNNRPLGNYSDETLKSMLARAEARLPKNADTSKMEDVNWKDRPYALVKTEKLAEMRIHTFNLLRSKEDAKELYIDDLRDNAYAMDAEWIRRAQASPYQKGVEQFIRGDKDASHRYTIAGALRAEVRLRESSVGLLPLVEPKKHSKNRLVNNVSLHTADTFWATSPLLTPEAKAILKAHRQEISELITLRGKEIAANPPTWAKELGEVPAYGPNAQRWYRVAGEVDAYRKQYKIADGEPTAIPKVYRESERGTYLQAEITAVHKSSRLSSQLISGEQKATALKEAAVAREQKEVTTEAEYALKMGNNAQLVASLNERIEELDTAHAGFQKEMAQLTGEITELTQQVQIATTVTEQQKDIFDKVHKDTRIAVDQKFYPVRQAQKGLEGAGLFGKSKAKGKYEGELTKFVAAHGGLDNPLEVKEKWVPLQPEVKAARVAHEQAQERMVTLQQSLEKKQKRSTGVAERAAKNRHERGKLNSRRAAYAETVQMKKARIKATGISGPSATTTSQPTRERTR